MTVNFTARDDGMFFVLFAALSLAAVLIGFAPTYYLQPYFGTPPLTPLLHVHGALFSSWLLLLIAQTSLAKTGRLALHRRLGWLGIAIAVTMTALGTYVTLVRSPLHPDPTYFYAAGLGDMVTFAGFVGVAVAMRRRTDAHRRLMILATIALLDAGVGRWPIVTPLFEQHRTQYTIETDLLTDAFLVAAMVFDRVRHGRVHRVYVWGGVALVASQVVRILLDL